MPDRGALTGQSYHDGLTGRETMVHDKSGPAVLTHPGPGNEGVIFDAG